MRTTVLALRLGFGGVGAGFPLNPNPGGTKVGDFRFGRGTRRHDFGLLGGAG